MVSNNCTDGVREQYTAKPQKCPGKAPRGLRIVTADGKLTAEQGHNVTLMVQLEEVSLTPVLRFVGHVISRQNRAFVYVFLITFSSFSCSIFVILFYFWLPVCCCCLPFPGTFSSFFPFTANWFYSFTSVVLFGFNSSLLALLGKYILKLCEWFPQDN